MKNSIIIPAYNEEKGLPVVVDDLLKVINPKDTELVVVDDGSKDKTVEVAKKLPVKLFKNPVNIGKGMAMQNGVKNALGENILFIDADNTYPVHIIPEMFKALDEGFAVFTKRNYGNVPWFNRLGNIFFTKVIRTFWKFEGNDPLSGLYGMKKEVFEDLNIESVNFAIETEIAVKIARKKTPIKEFEIEYKERLGESKLHPIKDGWRILKMILNLVTMFNPFITFVIPGIIITLIGLTLMGLTYSGPFAFYSLELDKHSFLMGIAIALIGFQILSFGFIAGIYLASERLINFISKKSNIRNFFYLGGILILGSIYLGSRIISDWSATGFADYSNTKAVGLFILLNLLGLQFIFFSLLLRGLAKASLKKKYVE